MQSNVDRGGVLNPECHGLALPPSGLFLAVEVGQVRGVVVHQGIVRIATVAQGAGFPRAHLQAVGFGGAATRVGRLRLPAEGCILEDGHAALGTALGVVADIHGSCGRVKEGDKSQRTKQQLCHDGSGKNLCDVLVCTVPASLALSLPPPPSSRRMGKNNFPAAGIFLSVSPTHFHLVDGIRNGPRLFKVSLPWEQISSFRKDLF